VLFLEETRLELLDSRKTQREARRIAALAVRKIPTKLIALSQTGSVYVQRRRCKKKFHCTRAISFIWSVATTKKLFSLVIIQSKLTRRKLNNENVARLPSKAAEKKNP
jgi:hypothetical protein